MYIQAASLLLLSSLVTHILAIPIHARHTQDCDVIDNIGLDDDVAEVLRAVCEKASMSTLLADYLKSMIMS